MALWKKDLALGSFKKLKTDHQEKVRDIQSVLSPSLLKEPYRLNEESEYYAVITCGHCYAATEAAYYLSAKDEGFVPNCAKPGDESSHWWLVHE